MPESEIQSARERGTLNVTQQRRLNVTCKYIDKLVCDIEQELHSAGSSTSGVKGVVNRALDGGERSRLIPHHFRCLVKWNPYSVATKHVDFQPVGLVFTRLHCCAQIASAYVVEERCAPLLHTLSSV